MIRNSPAFILKGMLIVSTVFLSTKISFAKIEESKAKQIACSVIGLKTSSVQETKASLSYQFKGLKVVEFGICYNSDGNPTVASQKVTDYQDEPKDVPDYISIKTSIRGLRKDTKYFVKAYVINNIGDVCYSDEVEFATPKEVDYSAMLNGPKTENYPNGQVMRKYKLKEGLVDGYYESYSDSGYIVSRQEMKAGIPHGTLTTYYRDGVIKSVTTFADGVFLGESSDYYPDAVLKSQSVCLGEYPKQSCKTKQYYPDGRLKSESESSDGEFVSSTNYDKQGRITYSQTPGKTESYSYDNDGWKHTSLNGEKCQCSRCNSN